MKPEDQIVAIAELDGWSHKNYFENSFKDPMQKTSAGMRWFKENRIERRPPDYLASRDAIVPVIEKQSDEVIGGICNRISGAFNTGFTQWKNLILSTPTQLAEALLRATGKWKS